MHGTEPSPSAEPISEAFDGAWLRPSYRHVGLTLAVAFAALGTAVALLVPPFHVPDERRHWLTAQMDWARLTTGDPEVCSAEVALVEHFDRHNVRFKPDKQLRGSVFSQVRGLRPSCHDTRVYPHGHVLAYPGLLVSRLLILGSADTGPRALFAFLLVRLLHGLGIGLVIARILWLSGKTGRGPPGLLLLLLVPLSPLFLQQSFGVTNDVVVNAFALYVAAWLIFAERMGRGDAPALLVLGLLTATTKPVSVPYLIPVVALRAILDGLEQQPAPARFRTALASQRMPLIGAAAVTAIGAVYALATPGLDFGADHARRQLAYMAEEPAAVAGVILTRFAAILTTPSEFLEHLGYLDTDLSPTTLHAFGLLAVALAAIDAAALQRLIGRRMRSSSLAGLGAREALQIVAGLGAVAAGLILSMAAIGFRAYVSASAVGGSHLFGVAARYLFSHGLVAMACLIATVDTLGSRSVGSGEIPTAQSRAAQSAVRSGRGHWVAALVTCVVGALLLRFGSSLFADLLQRYG